jgi:hypothetical protein
VPFRDTFVGLDPAAHGLKPVEREIYHGFIAIAAHHLMWFTAGQADCFDAFRWCSFRTLEIMC